MLPVGDPNLLPPALLVGFRLPDQHAVALGNLPEVLNVKSDQLRPTPATAEAEQDPGGNCAATPKTGCTTFTYDAADQLTAVTYSDGVTPNVTNIGYDNDGQRIGMNDGTGASSWVWDSLHRLTSYTNGAGSQVRYAYNLRNLATQITYPNASNVTRGYDDAGNWTSVQDSSNRTTTFGYDPNSNLTSTTFPAGVGWVATYTFDNADRMMSIGATKGSTTNNWPYSRDNNNQVTSDGFAPAAARAIGYSALNQVCYAGTSSTTPCASPPPQAQAFTHDAADNLTGLGSTTQQFNAGNRLCWTVAAASSNPCATAPVNTTSYSYDARGNRTLISPPTGSETCQTYDQASRLTSYAVGTGSSCSTPTTTTTYAYDGDGRRMTKTNGTATSYSWDVSSGLPLLIQDGSNSYIYGPGGLPLEMVSGTTNLWYLHDQLGSTVKVTDGVGATVDLYTYDAYGNVTASTETVVQPFRFAGEYRDAESGLYYLRARYYDPSTAQFISRDPLTALTRQPYAYVGDNPLNGTDPSGLMCAQFWDPSKCNNPLTQVIRIATNGGNHTEAVCVGGSASWFGVGGTAEVCGVITKDHKGNPIGFGTTETAGGGGYTSPGVSGLITYQVSSAQCIKSLGGPFVYTGGTVGEALVGGGSIAGGVDDQHRPVGVAEGGVGVGAYAPVPGAGGVGATNTYTQTWAGQ